LRSTTGTDDIGVYNSYTSTIETLTNSGMITAGHNGAENDGGLIGTLTNSGTITGDQGGVYNYGELDLLTNSGSINGTEYTGVLNEYGAPLTALTNSGTITGGLRGIGNFEGATIITLTNSGVVSSGQTGIENYYATIENLTNSGVITGVSWGVVNYGQEDFDGINTLTNSGTITGTNVGLVNTNYGSITIFANSGSISGGSTGVANNYDGTIDTLTNSGTLTGGNFGIANYGDAEIYTISNSGTIDGTGSTGIVNESFIATLTNTGTITGANNGVYNDGLILAVTNEGTLATISQLTNDGTISGDVFAVLNEDGAQMGVLYNNGTIIANDTAVVNIGGTIGLLANAGTITGTVSGVWNEAGVIDVLSNSGAITAAYAVTNDDGASIGQLANNMLGTISGVTYGVGNTDGSTIGTLMNSGLISAQSAILNDPTSTIGQLVNTGTLTSTSGAGVTNDGSIGTLINAGVITGMPEDVLNNAGLIGNLSNYSTLTGHTPVLNEAGGTISVLVNTAVIAGNEYGFENTGAVVGTLANSGTVSGYFAAMLNETGTVGLLDNSGSIISTVSDGVYNYDSSSLGTLINSGVISAGGETGVLNYDSSTLGTLMNSGTISGVSYVGVDNYEDSTIDELTNSGLISGNSSGVYNEATSTIGTIGNSGTISAVSHGVWNAGSIGTLGNSGVIIATAVSGAGLDGGAVVGVENTVGASIGVLDNFAGGTIGVLANAGAIIGASSGVDNEGSIGALSNSGVIGGNSSGVDNEGGSIGTLTNTGKIAGLSGAGIYNSYNRGDSAEIGTITQLSNSGTITGASNGVYNAGVIGTVLNSGTISGTSADGILNDTGGTLGAVTNLAQGSITGAVDGINAGSSVITIANAGHITGTNGDGVVFSGGTVSNVTGGTIIGNTGVLIIGNDATLFDAGSIASNDGGEAIVVAPSVDPAEITLTTGAKLTGAIDGGGTDGVVTLEGTNTLPNDIVDFGAGSKLNVVSGANWTAYGTWTIGSVTNSGTFQPGILGTPLDLTGNFTQAPGSTLQVVVTPTVTTRFIITGTAQLGGNLSYIFAPGTYTTHVYPFLTATGGVKGTFATASYNGSVPEVLTHETYGMPEIANLVLADTVDPTQHALAPVGPLYVSPQDDSIFSDAIQTAAQAAQEANAALLDHVSDESLAGENAVGFGPGFADESVSAFGNHYENGLIGPNAGTAPASAPSSFGTAGPTPGSTCAAAESASPAVTNRDAGTGAETTNALAAAFCNAGGWLEATGGTMNTTGGAAAPGYNADSGGFLAGIDTSVNPAGTRLGVAVGYDDTWLHDSAGGKDSMDTTRVGLYGAQPLGRFTLAGDFLVGFGNNTTTRQTGVGPAHSTSSGTDYAGGVQVATQLDANGFTLRPEAGLRFADVDDGSFAETGGGYIPYFKTHGNSSSYTSVQPYAKLAISRTYLTPSAIMVTPSASIGFDVEAGDTGRTVNVTSVDGTHFTAAHISLNSGTGEFAVGVAAGKDNWSLYAHYSAYVSGNWTAQVGEAGLTVRF
jgi:hypothetical protein